MGLRFDLIIISYVLMLPALILFLHQTFFKANKFFDNTKTRLGFSYGQVKGEDREKEGIAHHKPGNNYNYYAQQYLNDNLRVGYSLNLLDGRRDNDSSNNNDRAKVNSNLVNLEYYFSDLL